MKRLLLLLGALAGLVPALAAGNPTKGAAPAHISHGAEVALQYGMQSIPHFKVFGPDGKLLAEGQDARVIVNKLISALK